MENEKVIEIIKVQNELIRLLCTECELPKMKTQEESQRIQSLINTLRDFNEQVK